MALVLVTGASSGIGRLAAEGLARAGHDVVVHARSADRLPGGLVRVGEVIGDLSEADAVRGVAEGADRFGAFDAVIHNAGVIDGPDVFAVNVVAPYLLSALMVPPWRTIVISSSMHRSGTPDLANLDFARPEVRTRPYDDSKLFVTALALHLAVVRSAALVHAVDPGWVPTRMGGVHASDSLDEGSRTQEWLATAPVEQIDPRTGGYWFHRRTQSPHPATLDPAFRTELIEMLADHTGVVLPQDG
ncbi:SDR family NAD(P)-dependent oxidoreductase [Microbacterium phyllosphaerae]|uniref:SDR family NAD(P)-dependent oxidoreductase n=1 Tax=Microbacterium phyllosphaerae TaxID=124798 RepID=UPI003D64A2D9